jgi:hypothetical protein
MKNKRGRRVGLDFDKVPVDTFGEIRESRYCFGYRFCSSSQAKKTRVVSSAGRIGGLAGGVRASGHIATLLAGYLCGSIERKEVNAMRYGLHLVLAGGILLGFPPSHWATM